MPPHGAADEAEEAHSCKGQCAGAGVIGAPANARCYNTTRGCVYAVAVVDTRMERRRKGPTRNVCVPTVKMAQRSSRAAAYMQKLALPYVARALYTVLPVQSSIKIALCLPSTRQVQRKAPGHAKAQPPPRGEGGVLAMASELNRHAAWPHSLGATPVDGQVLSCRNAVQATRSRSTTLYYLLRRGGAAAAEAAGKGQPCRLQLAPVYTRGAWRQAAHADRY